MDETPLTKKGTWDAALGQTYVPPGETSGPLKVLDEARAEALRGWVKLLIPGNDYWPDASATDAVAYIDAILARAPDLRGQVLSALDRYRALGAGPGVLSTIEEERPDLFRALFEMTCEAYYRHPDVVAVVEARTGFRTTRPTGPVKMSGFDPARLDRVKAMPPQWREDPR